MEHSYRRHQPQDIASLSSKDDSLTRLNARPMNIIERSKLPGLPQIPPPSSKSNMNSYSKNHNSYSSGAIQLRKKKVPIMISASNKYMQHSNMPAISPLRGESESALRSVDAHSNMSASGRNSSLPRKI